MIYWIGVLSILIAIETVFAGTCFSIFFPLHAPQAVVQDLFTTYQHIIFPKRDVLFLRIFILVGIGSSIALFRYFLHKSTAKYSFLKYFTLLQAMVVMAEAFFLFKFALYHYPLWQIGFYVALGVSLLIKIFIPEIIKYLKAFNERLKIEKPIDNLAVWLTVSGMILIPLLIWIPDVKGAVARMFCGEQFHHMDWLLMAAGWVHLSGNVIGVDNISRYGIGAPVLVSEIAQRFWGRFDYETAVLLMMVISILYYWIWYYALRQLLKDPSWAFIAIFLGIRLHFFNIESFPCIFTYPQVTPLRCFFDSFFFLFLILHIQRWQVRWLYALSALSGFYIFYITGEGLYCLVVFYAFIILREFQVKLNPAGAMTRLNKKQLVQLAVLPWMVLVTSLWMVVGKHIFEGAFWFNQLEYIRFYQAGNSVALMINNLTAPYVLRASIAFFLPVVYLFILVICIGKLMQRKLKSEGIVIAAACFYLLMCYHYTATIATGMPSYLRNGVIMSLIIVIFIKHLTASLTSYQQRMCKLIAGISVFIMMVTTHQFLLHPNIFNLSRNPMTHPVVSEVPEGRNSYFSHLFISYPDAFKLPVNGLGETEEMLVKEQDFKDDNQLKTFYQQETDYAKDIALIQSLTSPKDKVPLVSSFENLILMQAKRRPFFYTYFMVNSQPRRMRKFPVTVIYTKENLRREIRQFEYLKPEYVFIERTYLVPNFPQAYLYDNEDLIATVSYILQHYKPYQTGEFLIALKRI